LIDKKDRTAQKTRYNKAYLNNSEWFIAKHQSSYEMTIISSLY